MSSPAPTRPSTAHSSGRTPEGREAARILKEAIDAADAVVLGAGAGLSAAAGLTYDGPRFRSLFADLIERYGLSDMYSAGFHPFPTPQERWAYWSRHVMANCYDQPDLPLYRHLLGLLEATEFFVVTTNADTAFLRNGLPPERLFAVQGSYARFQCSRPCRQETWDNEASIRAMAAHQSDARIPSGLLPQCPWCGAPAAMNLRIDSTFVQDASWDRSCRRYQDFLDRHGNERVLYLEIGVGWNTPGIIKLDFWRRVHANPRATYLLVNPDSTVPAEIRDRTIILDGL
ncbi:Sir2 silent information regulator family NAD-dependent deacetylase [Actinomyces capricornis]|uniref:Deacetylase sirtuin-type domain-containing protein n=1 Tax=Actinomyces capricornis TaxID=2755559 RepID=A0ABN6K2D5_9ACTO|nr:Sir2 silent information regulator family NAD-dependent deacetylase [Actinomyces capricornis]BDA63538.1 hypothetical protein MANAM107_03720 [Actinomyces capricornis]